MKKKWFLRLALGRYFFVFPLIFAVGLPVAMVYIILRPGWSGTWAASALLSVFILMSIMGLVIAYGTSKEIAEVLIGVREKANPDEGAEHPSIMLYTALSLVFMWVFAKTSNWKAFVLYGITVLLPLGVFLTVYALLKNRYKYYW